MKWLLKSEPETWSWDQQVAAGSTVWDGVRNHQANGYMKKMQHGEECFFYHSGKQKAIVGIARVTKVYYSDPTSPPFGMVDIETVITLPVPIPLSKIKACENLSHIPLVRQSRLSIMPIDPPTAQLFRLWSKLQVHPS